MGMQVAAGHLPAWQLNFFLKGSLRLERSGRPKPHAWLSDQVMLLRLLTTAFIACIATHVQGQPASLKTCGLRFL